MRSSSLSMMSLALGYSEPLAETDFNLSSCHGEWATLHKVNYTFTYTAKGFISNLMATVLNHVSSIKAQREWRFDGTFGISESMCNGSNQILGYYISFTVKFLSKVGNSYIFESFFYPSAGVVIAKACFQHVIVIWIQKLLCGGGIG